MRGSESETPEGVLTFSVDSQSDAKDTLGTAKNAEEEAVVKKQDRGHSKATRQEEIKGREKGRGGSSSHA